MASINIPQFNIKVDVNSTSEVIRPSTPFSPSADKFAILYKSLRGHSWDVATVLKEIYGKKLISVDLSDDRWFVFNGTNYELDEECEERLMRRITGALMEEYQELHKKYSNDLLHLNTNNLQEVDINNNMILVYDLINKLKNKLFCDNVIKDARIIFHSKDLFEINI